MKPSRHVVAGLVIALLLVTLTAHAADDSNSRDLTSAPSLNPQAVSSSLNSLAQNLNDPNLSQEIAQLSSQLASGNNKAAASTLLQLRTDAQNNPGASDSLKALLQSMSIGPNGASVDPNLLSAILGLNNLSPNGVPGGLRNESPNQVSVDLNTLSNLLKGVDPNLAAKLINEASQLGQSTGGLSFGNIRPPPISVPSITSGLGAFPSLSPQELLLPVLLIAAFVAVYFSKNRMLRVLGTQALPITAEAEDDGSYPGLNPQNPRHRIIILFGRAVQIMRGKGVPKLRSETHREFSSKCEARSEAQHVTRVSQLYERAKFSALDIRLQDADDAQREVDMLEKQT
jgi:hypothetical protein